MKGRMREPTHKRENRNWQIDLTGFLNGVRQVGAVLVVGVFLLAVLLQVLGLLAGRRF